MEPKFGAFYLNNEVTAHGSVFLVQLSSRVASPSRVNIARSEFQSQDFRVKISEPRLYCQHLKFWILETKSASKRVYKYFIQL